MFHFSLINNKGSKKIVTFLLGVLALSGLIGLNTAYAGFEDPLVVQLMAEPPTVINGQETTLSWYIDGPATGCSINNGIGSISTLSVPVIGSVTTIPPEDSSTNYILSCNEISDTALVSMVPEITMEITKGGTPVTEVELDSLTGRADITVDWSAEYATDCSLLWRESASNPGVYTHETSSTDYSNQYGISGYVVYDGSPRSITETTTFYITCFNQVNETETTENITITVTNPPPPGPITIDLYSPDLPSVVADEFWGYATISLIGYSSTNATHCATYAYNVAGELVERPVGWGHNSSRNADRTNHEYTNILIADSTVFEVECWRDEVTIAGVTYPATTVREQILIEVILPPGVESIDTWDRTSLPPVTASIMVDSNPVTLVPFVGAPVTASIEVRNADWCEQKAYQINGTVGDQSDDTEYNLTGWTKKGVYRISGHTDDSYELSLPSTTRLEIYCQRDYDVVYGDPAEVDNGSEIYNLVVFVEDTETLPDPQVSLYGNPSIFTVKSDRGSSLITEKIGFSVLTDYASTWSSPDGASYNRVTFSFKHPLGDGESSLYDIYLNVCDENDGESTFQVTTENSGSVGSLITNNSLSPSDVCDSTDTTTRVTKQVGSDVEITHGESITVECETLDDGENCRFLGIYFGEVNNGTIEPEYVSGETDIDVPLMWVSQEAPDCGVVYLSGDDGFSYSRSAFASPSSRTYNVPTDQDVSVSLTCGRTGDDKTHTGTLTISPTLTGVYESESFVSVGECYDENVGTMVTAPPGMMADPDNGNWCVPASDLAAVVPSFSIEASQENGVDGLYDNLTILVGIANIGPGDLPANSGVTYRSWLSFDSAYSLSPVYSDIGIFNDGIPVSSGPLNPPTLELMLDSIPFGNHGLCSGVNLYGSPNVPEANTDYTNNTNCTLVYVPVPQPPMTIESTGGYTIRRGETTEIRWTAHTSYPMGCRVVGAGGVDSSFDASVNHPTEYTESFVTNPLMNSSEFVLHCVEPITGESFTESIRVEVVPQYQEL